MTERFKWLTSALLIFCALIMGTPACAQTAAAQDVLVEDVEIRGNRRIPKESILYYVQSKPGDRYSQALAQRDLEAVVQLGFFDPIATKFFLDDGPRGGKVIIFQVKEYPIIRDLQYRNMKSATESEVLTRFKERRTQVSKESQLDPAKVNSARLVLRELLAEKGHPDAAVSIEVEDISATTVALIFNVEEGPRVRVKDIVFTGDKADFSQRRLRGAMKLVKESGLIATFTSKDIYFKEKLQDDLERVRFFLGNKGYLQARYGEPVIEPAGTVTSGIPLLPIPGLQKKGPGLRVSIPLEVGRRYKVSKVEEKGVTLFQPGVISAVSGMRQGEYANTKNVQENVYKGIKDLYGTQGYIQAEVNFVPKFTDKTDTEGEVEVTLEVDEGRQFSLRRLEFIGNTNTRDVVLRREVVLNEGDPYNKRYWDISILKLNQLGLFDEIKEKDAITRTNDRDQTVDIDVQVKEKGKQQISVNGGVSGFQGSFFGLDYSTNNLLGYGESLGISLSGGNRSLSASFSFSEPYLFGKPISAGFQLFAQKYQFIGSGFNFNNASQVLQSSFFGLSSFNTDTLFTQQTVGGTISLSSPGYVFANALFGRSRFRNFANQARFGLSYSLTATATQDPAVNRDADPNNNIPVTFEQPRILTSRVTPSLFYNTTNAQLDATRGQSIMLSLSLSGGPLGGDVNTFAPSFEYKRFDPIFRKRTDKPHVLAMRFRADTVRTFGKIFETPSLSFIGGVPIFERFYLGGEYDIRGYNIRSISPVVASDSFLSTRNVKATVEDPADATKRIDAPTGTVDATVLRNFTFQAPERTCTQTLNQASDCNVVNAQTFFTPIGGDTQFIYNLEYRVPILSILSVAAFADVGSVFNSRKYNDQVTSSNYLAQDVIPGGVLLNPSGRVATQEELSSAPKDDLGNAIGYRRVFLEGESRSFSILRNSQANQKFLSDVRSSFGMEVRIQMPVINVPFRLIFAYNPQAKTDLTDPKVLFIERRTAVRFSVGRTF
ncbi:MAG: outer membrane protein assembly factor BamA [Acidobacteria bacterium]|nr:outer membrane protein assembly factor BamA [Acidobacteriota bacterium]